MILTSHRPIHVVRPWPPSQVSYQQQDTSPGTSLRLRRDSSLLRDSPTVAVVTSPPTIHNRRKHRIPGQRTVKVEHQQHFIQVFSTILCILTFPTASDNQLSSKFPQRIEAAICEMLQRKFQARNS